jgi:hypothetical protein
MAPSPYKKVTIIVEGDAPGGPFKHEFIYQYPFSLAFEEKRLHTALGDRNDAVSFTLEVNKLLNVSPNTDIESVIKEK